MWDDTQVEVRNSHSLTHSFDRYSQSTNYVPGINNASWWQHGTVENRVPALSEIISQARNKWGKTLRLSQWCQKEMKLEGNFQASFFVCVFPPWRTLPEMTTMPGHFDVVGVHVVHFCSYTRGFPSNFVYQIWDCDSRCILTGHLIFFISQLVGNK